MTKRETLEEFLARGGEIKVLPSQKEVADSKPTVISTNYQTQIVDLDEGGLYFAESNRNKKPIVKSKVKSKKEVDVSKLPANLRKYL